jgi:hypothetical protein
VINLQFKLKRPSIPKLLFLICHRFVRLKFDFVMNTNKRMERLRYPALNGSSTNLCTAALLNRFKHFLWYEHILASGR